MAWQGTILGGSIGLMFGPMGAVAGAAAGRYFIDRKMNSDQKKIHQTMLTFYTAVLHDLALCDGELNRSEEELIKVLMSEYNSALGEVFPSGQLPVLMEKMVGIPNAGKRFANLVRENKANAQWIALTLFRIAAIDGNPGEEECAYLRAICMDMGLPEFVFIRLFTHYVRTPAPNSGELSILEAEKILNLPHNAPVDEVKRAFRTMTMKYHPDRHAGLPPEIMELAAEKFRLIQNAYRIISGTDGAASIQPCFKLSPSHSANEPCRISDAAGGDIARCIICGRDAILPDESNLISARCPFCQCRLTLMRHDLEKLNQEMPSYPNPHQ
jgi:DnaJ-domain-containing protein 1